MRKSILFPVFILFSMLAAAQPELSGIQFDNKVYVKGVTSVTLLPTNQIHGEPVMQLGKGYGQLSLTFDDLDEVDRYYKYTLIHCTHDWKPSDMNPIEYLDGFTEDELEVYNYSFNTITHYVQHQLVFPTQNMQITRSGNYLLLVYDDTPDQPVLTRRFMVLESDPVGIDCQVHAASDVNDRFTKQEIDFSMTTGSYLIRNPAMTVHATIKQNGRWDNAIYGLTYRSGYPGVLSFDYDDGRNVMPGGAEFRTFDISTLHSNADRIVGITYANHENHAYVLQDDARPFGAYESRSTMNGDCFYRNRDMQNAYSEDYVNTHFTLKSGFPFDGGDVYVFGKLTDWQILPEAKLHYNKVYQYWETNFLIKQGMYNYQYVFVPTGTSTIDATYIEGSHYETLNSYTILIYFQEEGSSYDRLIGMTTVR
ncbi:MAG: DUF5103 domain-containing protein [Bacteroidales bacterium]|nr:DUF5103 domain-containing protein [Bacteroidales bacterium]